jgi:hypothetical protein
VEEEVIGCWALECWSRIDDGGIYEVHVEAERHDEVWFLKGSRRVSLLRKGATNYRYITDCILRLGENEGKLTNEMLANHPVESITLSGACSSIHIII